MTPDIAMSCPGDVFTYDGVEWVVVGMHLGPSVMLRRRDVAPGMPAGIYAAGRLILPILGRDEFS